jgi:hypothetical protein
MHPAYSTLSRKKRNIKEKKEVLPHGKKRSRAFALPLLMPF